VQIPCSILAHRISVVTYSSAQTFIIDSKRFAQSCIPDVSVDVRD